LHLSCQTQEQIVEAVGMSRRRVSEILAEIANLQIPPNLGDFSNIADDAARQEGRAAGVRAAGWAWRKSDTRMDSSCECG
jgi:transcriptional regulator with XRE-family HTH domain